MTRNPSLVLALLSLLLPPALSQAAPPKGKAPACKIKADSSLWRVKYCMYTAETDDMETAMADCKEDPKEDALLAKMSECEQSLYWKQKICEELASQERLSEVGAKNVQQCVASKKLQPAKPAGD